jgi:hypothetical protein
MVFLVHNRAREILLAGLITAVMLACTGCGRNGAEKQRDLEAGVIERQQKSMMLLGEYFKAPDLRKRIAVERLSGVDESLAARTYRMFRVSACRQSAAEEVQEFNRLLGMNPHLTLTLLRPIIDERELTPDELFEVTEKQGLFISDDEKGTVLSICATVAQVEKDGFASEMLRDLATHSESNIAQRAVGLLEFVEKNNYQVMSERYKKDNSSLALQWLVNRFLRDGMSREELEKALGTGTEIDEFRVKYSSDGEPPVRDLLVAYMDGCLTEWGWYGMPKD